MNLKDIDSIEVRDVHSYADAFRPLRSYRVLYYFHGALNDTEAPAHLILEGFPGEGPDGTCRVEVLASCSSFEAALAVGSLLNGTALHDWVRRPDPLAICNGHVLPNDPFDLYCTNEG